MSIQKIKLRLNADPKKVVIQFLWMNKKRTKKILKRIILLSDKEIVNKLNEVYEQFSARHKNFEELVLENYRRVEEFLPRKSKYNEETKHLIGAYFSKEYSIESAALFNPSVVVHPDQTGIESGELKFVMSLRATGEGHISAVEFREGIISSNGDVRLINDSQYRLLPKKSKYPFKELKKKKFRKINTTEYKKKDLITSNYRCRFDEDSVISERVLPPVSLAESKGIEDARFVKFDDKNFSKYFATYTAYNGKSLRTQIIETTDFKNFELGTLHGKMVNNKGMALFPRKINGKYFMTSRQDGENLYMMESDNIYKWNKSKLILKPRRMWELMQLGNCGSPIETDEGWLLLTHAVGPVRKYVISAILLDIENPYKVIGVLNEPLLEPDETEREGYVPHVVYSCGSIIHNNYLVIPYAMSDSACGFAKIELDKLLNKFF